MKYFHLHIAIVESYEFFKVSILFEYFFLEIC